MDAPSPSILGERGTTACCINHPPHAKTDRFVAMPDAGWAGRVGRLHFIAGSAARPTGHAVALGDRGPFNADSKTTHSRIDTYSAGQSNADGSARPDHADDPLRQ